MEHDRAPRGAARRALKRPADVDIVFMADGLMVVQIVPRLGSQLDGVADYACALGAALRRAADADIRFLSCDASEDRRQPNEWRLHARSGTELASNLTKLAEGEGKVRAVLVHYVNYGYEVRGCPFWLIEGLKEWKRSQPGERLITMFHEIYASGPPWRSSFWLSPLQRRLTRELHGISDQSVTNREKSRQWLDRGHATNGPRTSVMPVFSSLGEPERLRSWSTRSTQMIVAGRTGTTGRAYGRCRDQLADACRALEIDEILDVGARSDPVPSSIEGIRVTALGHLAPTDARTVFVGARAGFIDYPSDYLGKSTVFAAYAAHGLVPVVSSSRGAEETGLEEGVNYWVPSRDNRVPRDFESIANRASAWYAGHRLELQALEYAQLLRGESA